MNINSLNDLVSQVQASLGLEQEVEKQASLSVSAEGSLEEMLIKAASTNESNTDGEIPQMNKQAQATGIALADEILATLVKKANEVVMETAEQVMQDDAKIIPNPTQEQTVTDVLQNHILKAIADGAAQENAAVAAAAPSEAAVEGAAQVASPAVEGGTAVPMMGAYGSEMDKAAAVSHLVGEGRSFEDAVTLVKQAEQSIRAEHMEMAKVAAATTLIKEAGISLDEAVALVNYGVAQLAG